MRTNQYSYSQVRVVGLGEQEGGWWQVLEREEKGSSNRSRRRILAPASSSSLSPRFPRLPNQQVLAAGQQSPGHPSAPQPLGIYGCS